MAVAPSLHRPRALTGALLAALAALLGLAPDALASAIVPEAGGSENADDIRGLYMLILAMAVIVFLGVEGILFYCLWRYRARRGQVAAQIHGNTRLEIGWTVAAALILIYLSSVTFIQLGAIKNPPGSDIDANGSPLADAKYRNGGALLASTDQPPPPPGTPAMIIRVDGQQYLWRYQYPGRERIFSYVDMVVPVGRTVVLEITADDVAHSWWIPELGGKMDALPGYVNKTWFKVPEKALKGGREVIFEGQCAELCGRNHANMLARVRAVPFADYQRWYDGKVREIEADRRAAAEQRARLVQEQGEQATQSGGAAGGNAPQGSELDQP